ncbi:MAG: citrate synthase [Planctomycetales bacterium]|nr:citrate synthase [Planctomycetales bacterium]
MAQKPSGRFEGEGLEGIKVSQTEVCFIDGGGPDRAAKLLYRGYNIHDLAVQSSYEETVHLLLYGTLPTRSQLDDLRRKLGGMRALPPEVLKFLQSLPRTAKPMDVLRTAVSALSFSDPRSDDVSVEVAREKGLRLVAQFGTIMAAWDRVRSGKVPVPPDPELGHAANFLLMQRGQKADDLESRALDVCLVLHAEHDFNASTFSARVTIATLTDFYSAITSAVGTLKGPLHGGANEGVMKNLNEIGTPDKVEGWVQKQFAAKQKIMGFGHRVYKTEDPRATHLRKMSLELGKRRGNTTLYDMSIAMEGAVKREKGLSPNVDFYSATVYHAIGLPLDLFTPIFAVSRIAGWSAHVIEQLSNNRLIRPLSEYVGAAERPYLPVEKR